MIETSAAPGACLLVLIVAITLDRRPYHPGKLNYVPIMIVALAASLVLGRHLLTLMAQNWGDEIWEKLDWHDGPLHLTNFLI